jgi:predicted RNA-binding Zn ribbon-like protein
VHTGVVLRRPAATVRRRNRHTITPIGGSVNRQTMYGGCVTQQTDWPGLGDEDLLIALANTGHTETDELIDPPAVRRWWRGLQTPISTRRPQSTSPEGPAMLRSLRAVIRGLALRNNGINTDVDTAGLADFALRPDLRGNLSLHADGPADLAHDICAATITALLRASARPGWPRLKACRGEDCRWVFIDNSRNTSRRWCDMAGCGNRAKSTSFRLRHRTAETST